MPSKIRVLSEHTINKIAAGEVIENPASVVKELVENSLDAGSTEICIEIKGGGRQLIRITDNGCGMNADDAILCLERHATSKIKEVEDIHSIYTMGFRGEAVPSIAAISKFTLLTCPSEPNSQGTLVIVDGGKLVQCSPAVRSPGTTIEVKSLFFNVPVRKKFQKSPAHDTNEILKIVSVIALGYPEIKFQLISDQKNLLLAHVSPENSLDEKLHRRIDQVLGADFFQAAYSLKEEKGDYRVEGVVGTPSYNRPNRTGQYLFINHRPVFSPFISYCVREGYGTTLPANRHPVYVLHLTIPGSLVDVNVHPQKKEVRLRQEHHIKEIITQGVKKALQQEFERALGEKETQDLKNEYVQNFSYPTIKPAFSLDSRSSAKPLDSFSEMQGSELQKKFYGSNSYKSHELNFIGHSYPANTKKIPQEEFQDIFSKEQIPIRARVLGSIDRYILIEGSTLPQKAMSQIGQGQKDGLCLVDQRGAHARIIFERLLQRMQAGTVSIQALLFPYTMEATPIEAAVIRENLTILNSLGIKIHEIGSHTFLIEAIPQIFGSADLDALIADIIHRLKEFKDKEIIEKEKVKQIALAASRAAVSHQKRLSFEEAQALINQLMECQMPYQCPQGKPTIAYIPQEELNKQFLKFAC